MKDIRQKLDEGVRYHAASDSEKKLVNPNYKKPETISGVYYIARCFGGYVEFNGKANRPEFWYFALFIFILTFEVNVANKFTSIFNKFFLFWANR